MATSHSDQAELQAEVLALHSQVQVLERQIKRVRWTRTIGGISTPTAAGETST